MLFLIKIDWYSNLVQFFVLPQRKETGRTAVNFLSINAGTVRMTTRLEKNQIEILKISFNARFPA